MTIGALVERERAHLRRREMLAGALAGAGIAAIAIGIAAAWLGNGRWLVLPRSLPLAIWVVVGGALLALSMWTRRRLHARSRPAHVALAIEREQGMRRGLLVGAMELEGQGALARQAAKAAHSALPQGVPLAPALRHASARRTIVAGVVAAAGLLMLAVTPLFGDGFLAVLRPIDAWRGTLLTPLRITDLHGNAPPRELVRGARLALLLDAGQRHVIYVRMRQTGEPWRTDTVVIDPARGKSPWTLDAIRGDVRLVATDGRSWSDTLLVRAADRPFVGGVTLHATYPAYLGRPPESLPVGEPLRLPRGTTLAIAGRASVPLSVVRIAGAGDSFELPTSGHSFSGRLVLLHSMHLPWSATGPDGAVPDVPPPLDIEVLGDSAPHVTITSPTGDTLLVGQDAQELGITASDDHGLSSVELRVLRDAMTVTDQQLASSVGSTWAGSATLDVAALHLAEGASVRARAEAVDASPWGQRGISRELVIRRATAEELRSSARALGDSAVKEARAAAVAQRSLAQRTDEAAHTQTRPGATKENTMGSTAAAAQQKNQMDFESAEKARALAQEQRAMTDRVQKLRQATQQLQEQLKAAGALDSSLARQLAEAQALMRQALTPQMLAQMQKLENASQQMNGDQSREALRDLAQMQQRMREQLERSAEMLKRAAHEGAMQTLGDQARDLAAKQQSLADSSQRSGGDRKGAESREASKLAEQSARLRQQIDDLKERLAKDKADAGASRTEQAGQHAAKSETGMRRAANEMQSGSQNGSQSGSQNGSQSGSQNAPQSGQPKPGAERAREAAAEMNNAAKAMQDARAAQVKEWKQELTGELDQAVQEMMQLAREERSLEQDARSGQPNADRRGAQSAVEQGVQKAEERLQGEGKKSALLSPRSQRAVSDAKQKVGQATQSVSQSQGSPSQQASALGDAADALTKAAASLARDRERANSASSASGFSEMMQQMQEAAQKQGQINSQAQGLMSMPNPGGTSAGQALARSLAQKQRGVADQLDDAGEATGGDRAAQLAREARQLADALDGGRLDASTLARQQQLFRRLLDAGRSLEKEEREDSGKREATTAKGTETFTPGVKADGKAAIRFRPPSWDELRGLSADERRAILDYFTRLNSASSP